ncbi:MAG: helix-turn-helix domain-containing protein [Nitrospirae bacterium]|nr:helix-turn-helix domain-containing protein [Nitrospirota bacterium]
MPNYSIAMLTAKDIKKALIDKEISMREIARRIGVSYSSISLVINRRGLKSERVRKGIAECLAMPYDLLWGVNPASNCTDNSLADCGRRVND